jgi:hypothetical protein
VWRSVDYWFEIDHLHDKFVHDIHISAIGRMKTSEWKH